MSRSGGMSQLLKGIIIGVVLIMAIIGTMSLLDKDNPLSKITDNKDQLINKDSQDISAPSITLNPNNNQNNNDSQDTSNIGDLNAELPNDVSTPIVKKDQSVTNQEIIKPVLEDERQPEEAITKDEKPITYGMMEINAINPNNSQNLKASYTIFDQKNVKVAESKNVSNASYRLPIGQYKVETTLTRIDEATNQIIPVLTKSRYMIIRANSTAKQTFELEPPASTGILQVSAKMNDQIINANFIIQKINGEVVASRNNVKSSLFKLKTGTYKVSVNSGNNKDFRSVEVKAGESTQTVFILKQAAQQGKLLVRIFDTNSSNPVRADITITNVNGSVIQDIKAATQTELSLAVGDYNIKVIGPNGTSNKKIRVNAGQALNEIFRFDLPQSEITKEEDTQDNGTQINENVTIKPIENETPVPTEPENINNKPVTLSIVAKDELTKKPIKSNIYIQTTAGKHLDKRTYVDSANFSLAPGVYKVTVRAKNRNNSVKTIRVSKDQNINETFLLVNPNQTANTQNNKESSNITTKPVQANNKPNAIATGFLNVSMQAARNQRVNQNTLKTHFIVAKSSGEKIVELTSVQAANFKLDVGSYIVTAINNNKRRNQRVNIRQNQNTRLTFNNADFQAIKGTLKSRIVDENGTPVRANLVVTNTSGQIVARANKVSSGVFNLPPARYTISINYQGLSGSEAVNINANEITVQTFTIAPNRNTQQNTTQNRNSSRDIKDILKEKIKKEIRKQF